MNITKIFNVAKSAFFVSIASITLLPLANAAVVFDEQFNQVDPVVYGKIYDPTANDTKWVRSQYFSRSSTTAEAANGRLTVFTKETPYGGLTTPPNPVFNFFERELTFSFKGVVLESLSEDGLFSAQGINIGIGSYLAGMSTTNRWASYSNFTAVFIGSGYFSLGGYNKLRNLERAPIQEIPTPYLNYHVSDLTEIKLTLDDLNYRLLFVFGNPLNTLSFAGAHNLRKDLWHVSDEMRSLTLQKIAAEARLAATDVNDAQALTDAEAYLASIVDKYDVKYLEEEAMMGTSALFFGALSSDREGATVSVDSITVEETSVLQILR